MVKAARQRENTKEKRVISSKKATSNELLIRRSLVRVQQGEPKIDFPEYREPLYSGRSTPIYKRISSAEKVRTVGSALRLFFLVMAAYHQLWSIPRSFELASLRGLPTRQRSVLLLVRTSWTPTLACTEAGMHGR